MANIITRPEAESRIRVTQALLSRAMADVRDGRWKPSADAIADAIGNLQDLLAAFIPIVQAESVVTAAACPVSVPRPTRENESHVFKFGRSDGRCNACGRKETHSIHGGAYDFKKAQKAIRDGVRDFSNTASERVRNGMPVPPEKKPIVTEPPKQPIITPPPATGSTTIASDKTEVTFDFAAPFTPDIQSVWDNLPDELRGKISTRFNEFNKPVTVKLRGVAITVGKHEGK